MPKLVPSQGGRWNGLTGGEILPVHSCHNEGKQWCGLLPGLVPFLVGGPSSSARSGGAICGLRCMVLQSSAARGNLSYLVFWAVTGDPWYPGY
jgi:hypothetical protein